MIQKFDELNTISKYSEKKTSRRKIPINEYFENMNISSEQKEKRIRLANLLLADVLFLFALSKRNSDKEYLSKSLQNRYTDSVKHIVQMDKKMKRYIRKVCDSIVNTTLSNNSNVAGDMESDGENISSENDYTTSIERATSIAENEANAILNNDEYKNAVKHGFIKKRWISFGDESVRTDHADVDGEVVDIDKPFHVGDCLMMYPKDDSLGAGLEEIVNCRCSVEYLHERMLQTEMEDDIITEKCIIQRNKIVKYLLKPGAKHYDEFISVGYSHENPRKLAEDIIEAFNIDDIEGERKTEHGISFNVHMQLGVGEKKRFNTAWQIDINSDVKIPRLISAYREDE